MILTTVSEGIGKTLKFLFLGQLVKASRHGVEPADPSGVEVVIKALKDLVIFIGRCVIGSKFDRVFLAR